MEMKCDNCIHKRVCKGKPPESYPQFMIDIMTDKCEHYINNTDIQPVKHGHWIEEYDCGYITPHCSECGETALTKEETSYDYVYSSYYPRCGARMDGNEVE